MNLSIPFKSNWSHLPMRRSWVFGSILVAALVAFETFNYSTTEFALSDVLGDLHFGGLRWATILAIAFCGIDFAGLARLLTPESERMESKESYFLFGAWLLAGTMNAILTWWGVTIALLNHQTLGNEVLTQKTLLSIVPIFVALMVWLVRVLMIGTFSSAGLKLFNQIEILSEFHSTKTEKPSSFSNNVQKHKDPLITPSFDIQMGKVRRISRADHRPPVYSSGTSTSELTYEEMERVDR